MLRIIFSIPEYDYNYYGLAMSDDSIEAFVNLQWFDMQIERENEELRKKTVFFERIIRNGMYSGWILKANNKSKSIQDYILNLAVWFEEILDCEIEMIDG